MSGLDNELILTGGFALSELGDKKNEKYDKNFKILYHLLFSRANNTTGGRKPPESEDYEYVERSEIPMAIGKNLIRFIIFFVTFGLFWTLLLKGD